MHTTLIRAKGQANIVRSTVGDRKRSLQTKLSLATSSRDLKNRKETQRKEKQQQHRGKRGAETRTSELPTSDAPNKIESTENTRRPLRSIVPKKNSSNVVSRLARAAKEAAAAAKRKKEMEANMSIRTTKRRKRKLPQRPQTFVDDEEDDELDMEHPDLSTTSDLNKVIDEELLHPADGYRPPRETNSMRVLLEHNMNQQVDIQELSEQAPATLKQRHKSNKEQHAPHQVAIVFARPLIEDQITIEYASRLITLAKAIMFENYRPECICFCESLGTASRVGSKQKSRAHASQGHQKNSVSSTAAGIVFFRHLCAANGISLEETGLCQMQVGLPKTPSSPSIAEVDDDTDDYDDYDYDEEGGDVNFATRGENLPLYNAQYSSSKLIRSPTFSSMSWSPSMLRLVVESLVDKGYLEQWLDQSNVFESGTDEYGMTRQDPRKKIHVHWTLFSTEYDLCNLNDIHVRSPRQSPLSMLVHDLEQAVSQKLKHGRGIVQTTWSFHYSMYPYVFLPSSPSAAKENGHDLIAFLGKCFLMAQELVPLLVNLRGVSENSEFFQRDNYRRLVKIRRSLATLLEQMNEAYLYNRDYQTNTMLISPSLKAQLKKITSSDDGHGNQDLPKNQIAWISSTEIHLESALLSLGRCCDLVRPAGTFSPQSVSKQDWKAALRHLYDFMHRIEGACDPDRPLPARKWGVKLLEDQSVIEILS